MLGIIWLLAIFFDDGIIFLGVVALALFIGFFGINQLPIFYSTPLPEKGANVPSETLSFSEEGALPNHINQV